MAKGAFLYNNLAAGLTATGTTPVTGLGFSRLNDSQPRHRLRFAATSAFIIFDLGSAQSVDCAALLSTSLTLSDSVRLRASNSDATVTGSLVTGSDTGVLSGVTDAKWNGNVIAAYTASISGRYWRWDLTGSNPIDIGLAPMGLLFRPGRNFSFGIQEGKIDYGVRDVNPDTGAAFGVSGPLLRSRMMNFGGLSKTEARAQVEEMDRLIGASGDVLFVEDPADSWINRAQNSIWGSYRVPGQSAFATRQAYNVFARPYTMVERL